MESLVQYKRLQVVVRWTIKAAKRAYWRTYCSEICREVKLSDVWGMIRKLSGIRRNVTIPILSSNSRTAVSGVEEAMLLVETLIKVHSSENLSAEANKQRSIMLAQNTWVNKNKLTTEDNLDLPFSMYELRRAISSTLQSAAGKNDIFYCMLDNMDDRSLEVILKLINRIWDLGEIPAAWKHSVKVPILKPGKVASDQLLSHLT